MREGQANFSRAAGQAYQELSSSEREDLRREACKEVNLTQKEVLRRGDKIFQQIQGKIFLHVCNNYVVSHGKPEIPLLVVGYWKPFGGGLLET